MRREEHLLTVFFLISLVARPSLSDQAFLDSVCKSESQCAEILKHKVLEERGDGKVSRLAVSWSENGADGIRGSCKGATLTLRDESGKAEGVFISFEIDGLTMGQKAGRQDEINMD